MAEHKLETAPACGHTIYLMEEALHACGKCTEFDQIVLGVYCPLVECRQPVAPREAGRAGEGER